MEVQVHGMPRHARHHTEAHGKKGLPDPHTDAMITVALLTPYMGVVSAIALVCGVIGCMVFPILGIPFIIIGLFCGACALYGAAAFVLSLCVGIKSRISLRKGTINK
jgi:hypothetical protein